MVIRKMSTEECVRVLADVRLARLGCSHDNQPYVVPVYLAYDQTAECLYGFTTPGQKVEWMRANPLVCVEVDETVAPDRWVSVVVSGRYEELSPPWKDYSRPRVPEVPRPASETMSDWSGEGRRCKAESEGCNDEREQAWRILKTHSMWWEPGMAAWAARPGRDLDEPYTLIYYRIRIDRVTGHEASRDAGVAGADAAATTRAGG